MRVVVAGGGMAGSLAAVLLSDAGADVVLVDPHPAGHETPDAAWGASRAGCPQMHHTHNFLASYWDIVRGQAPDVADDVELSGALRTTLPTRLHVRRTTLRSALAGALQRRGVEVVAASVGALEEGDHAARVWLHGGRRMRADLVVDATGRRSRLADLVTESDEPAGIVYVSRHFRARSGPAPDQAASGFGRGYVASYARHDAGTFSCVLGVEVGRPEIREWRSGRAFGRAMARIPGFAELVDPDVAEPLHDVQVMGGLRNSLRVPRTTRSRVVALGDALGTTDPSRGRGSALAASQAAVLADLVRSGVAPDVVAGRYYEEVLGPLRAWWADARASCRWRNACWSTGVEPAPLHRDPARRSAWEWLQTPPVDDDERHVRIAYSQMSATPEEVVAAGRVRGDEGRTLMPSTRLPAIERLATREGVCVR